MHRWRKRVKDLRYAAVMLDRRDPEGSLHGRGHDHGDAAEIRRLARQADDLGELLGEEHDLALLAARLTATGKRGSGPRLKVAGGTRKALLKLIARRRRQLRSRALKRGKRLYGSKPGAFVRRVGDAYADAWLAY